MFSLNSLTNPFGFLFVNGFACSSTFIYIPFTAKLLEYHSVLLFRHIGTEVLTLVNHVAQFINCCALRGFT